MTVHTCAISGETSPGKHYILKTTEGEETVCPEALFHNQADYAMARMLIELQNRVQHLEEKAGTGDGQEDGDVHQDEAEPQASKPAAKKTASRVARPRKAAD